MSLIKKIVIAIEQRSESPNTINEWIVKLMQLKSARIQDNLFKYTLPNGSSYNVTEADDVPNFMDDMNVARSLIPGTRKYILEETPGKGAQVIVIASPMHEGPGYISEAFKKPSIALTHAALKARMGMGLYPPPPEEDEADS